MADQTEFERTCVDGFSVVYIPPVLGGRCIQFPVCMSDQHADEWDRSPHTDFEHELLSLPGVRMVAYDESMGTFTVVVSAAVAGHAAGARAIVASAAARCREARLASSRSLIA